jgi:hypothetical protein
MIGVASTSYPSGSNSRRATASPPRHGTTGRCASRGNGVSASSGRSSLRPASAVPKSFAIVVLMNDDATYGRSFT